MQRYTTTKSSSLSNTGHVHNVYLEIPVVLVGYVNVTGRYAPLLCLPRPALPTIAHQLYTIQRQTDHMSPYYLLGIFTNPMITTTRKEKEQPT